MPAYQEADLLKNNREGSILQEPFQHGLASPFFPTMMHESPKSHWLANDAASRRNQAFVSELSARRRTA